jgi:hypothetical protein
MEEIGFIRSKASVFSVGLGSLLKETPLTDARAMSGAINTLQANLGFQQLQQMRNLSKTGGALGQVSERELALLVSTVASLDQGMSLDDFNRSLSKITRHYNRAKEALQIIVDRNTGEITREEAEHRMQLLSEGQSAFDAPDDVSGLSDDELKRQINGG